MTRTCRSTADRVCAINFFKDPCTSRLIWRRSICRSDRQRMQMFDPISSCFWLGGTVSCISVSRTSLICNSMDAAPRAVRVLSLHEEVPVAVQRVERGLQRPGHRAARVQPQHAAERVHRVPDCQRLPGVLQWQTRVRGSCPYAAA